MFNSFIENSNDLVTTYEQTRAGFLSIALEKNLIGDPYVKRALAFKAMVAGTKSPEELLHIAEVRPFMLTASGLSDKAMQYLSEEDKTASIIELIEKFLKPAGENYVDEAVFRFLLIKGDAVGGIMRNRIGALGQEKLVRAFLSCLSVRGITYQWFNSNGNWTECRENDAGIEKDIKAISWNTSAGTRVLAFNLKIPTVKKNVDICLFNCNIEEYEKGKIVNNPNKALMFGELKGGIDPAGADEHWKTANTALNRIRDAFNAIGIDIKTSFVGAAIASAMAEEIYEQLCSEHLSNAANLTNNNQLVEYCNWILDL